ncbi:3-oxoacyl-[acyl-carrier protein] reductase [Streptomyces sp. Ag109_G2-6]|uniref:SDR family NAD(P)-dependent oxidoreductase n=1 Tax=Streptomyces TaxID=1883 RepID=UPI0009A53463|nr:MULTISPECIES: SDR family oxidoreductase [Streptomyces]RPF44634.1 3-oxoacyl-[acyl-carrier protein] reductase [Streptomyces sp. Ag109_G2-6]
MTENTDTGSTIVEKDADEGRVAVVSGGSRGLGRVLVERLLADGWRVATFSRSASDFIAEASAAHPESFYWEAVDLGEPETARGFVRNVHRVFGRLDLLVNNAGIVREELLFTMPPKAIEAQITANLVAPIMLTQACARVMTRQGGGAIVNISSINAIRGYRGVSVYAAAKAGLDGFTRSLARELGGNGIRVNSVVPGYFDSAMTAEMPAAHRGRIERRTPLGRLAAADDVADAVLYLSSPRAQFVTGQSMVIDGGLTC